MVNLKEKYLSGESVEAIAHYLGRSVGTVKRVALYLGLTRVNSGFFS